MAPTPYNAGFRLDIYYDVASIEHVVQFPVDSPSGAAPYSLSRIAGGTRLVTDCVADFTTLAKQLLKTTSTFTRYVLFENVSGIFVPRESGAAVVAGASSGTTWQAGQITITFRDLPYKIARFMMFETIVQPPGKINYPSGLTVLDDLIESMLPGSIQANPINEFIRSRGDNAITTTTGGTATFNRKLRRARGMV